MSNHVPQQYLLDIPKTLFYLLQVTPLTHPCYTSTTAR